MGKASRDKGARGEREVAEIFRAAGFSECERTPNSGGLMFPSDLLGLSSGLHVEVKRAERLDIPAWLRQTHEGAQKDVGVTLPVLCFRRNARGNDPLGEWHAVLPLRELATLLKLAEDWGP